MIPHSFFKDVEKKLQYILYGDTDSQFLFIPQVKVDENNLEPAIKAANEIAEDINFEIEKHMNDNVLPKLGIDPQYNRTAFKTEIIANSIFFLGIKKNYAYKLLVKEGNIIPKKPIEYAGLISKSDLTTYTKVIIQGLIEDIMFDTSITPKEKLDKATRFIISFKEKIIEDVNNFNFKEIGQPKKWSIKTKNNEDTWQIYGMRLYNTIMEDPLFKPMGGGVALPITITNHTGFLQKIEPIKHNNEFYLRDSPLSKLNYIVFPYSFDIESVKERMKEFYIKINIDALWDKICGTNVKDIMNLISQYGRAIYQYIGSIR